MIVIRGDDHILCPRVLIGPRKCPRVGVPDTLVLQSKTVDVELNAEECRTVARVLKEHFGCDTGTADKAPPDAWKKAAADLVKFIDDSNAGKLLALDEDDQPPSVIEVLADALRCHL